MFLRLFLALLTFVTITSCRKAKNNSEENYLQAPLVRNVNTLDPAKAFDVISSQIIQQVYEPLYTYHYLKRPYQIIPLLADGMPQIDNDGRTYLIKIKKNIPYHDSKVFEGKERFVKAQDFITQLKRIAAIPTQSRGWWLFDGRIKGLNEFRNKLGNDFSKFEKINVSGLNAINDHTLKIELTQPYPQIFYAMAMSFMVPIPAEVISKSNNDFRAIDVGTGPFSLQSWKDENNIILKMFPKYRDLNYPLLGDRYANEKGLLKDAGKRAPFINGIHFHVIKEDQTRWLKFVKGELDYIEVPKDNFSKAITSSGTVSKDLERKDILLDKAPTLIYYWIAFNMKDPIIGKNKNLRLAIASAVNTDKLIELFTNNVGQKATSIYPPGIPGYSPSRELPYEYSIDKAKAYLKAAGYPDGKGLPSLNYDIRGSSTSERQKGEFIKNELAKIGIKVNVITNTFPAFLKKSYSGQLQFWHGGWGLDYPDAQNILQLLITQNHAPGSNTTFYSNKNFDHKYQELKLLPDSEKKFLLMDHMETLVLNDLPWAMLYYDRKYILKRSRLKNYRFSDLIKTFKYIRLSKD